MNGLRVAGYTLRVKKRGIKGLSTHTEPQRRRGQGERKGKEWFCFYGAVALLSGCCGYFAYVVWKVLGNT